MEIRKAKFKDNPMIPEGLDLVEEDDQITHFLSLDDDDITAENQLGMPFGGFAPLQQRTC